MELISFGALEGVGILHVSKLLHQANSEKKSYLSVCMTDTVLLTGTGNHHDLSGPIVSKTTFPSVHFASIMVKCEGQ